MGFLGGAKTPKVATPAKRPERVVEVSPEDIELGSVADAATDSLKKSGKRSLSKPLGAAPVSGLVV